ncbi:MAG: UDP-N-acetylglucosamine 2-epimerase (non-hydrolyzing) [Acidobacteria bacterium]|nr:UDP-N-acetylglucosamine 2-epimerase (non-hydrolyzing) [Acidobacteriota bacterium]MCA1627883.1 UDP-N-acetylglucosamine 2-epimerase (non-hydrolyzing) [Acidobacteriota bacterium]
MLKVINVVGARPNFMKVAPIVAAMKRRAAKFQPLVVHTGQHYDAAMSDSFFRDLELPQPDTHLGVGSASHAAQTAAVMERFEPVVISEKPDWVLVVGDVNSTLACALVCVKLGVKVAHVEAGLRSRDRTMPEEINRLLTDQIADLLLTPSSDADANLRAEGIPAERIRLVGNVMIDSLLQNVERARGSRIKHDLGVVEKDYGVLTLHRPSNVDSPETFARILAALETITETLPVIFPVHPRTRKTIAELGLSNRVASMKNLRLIDPLGYLDFLSLYSAARLVLTDSGGIQEETSALGIPCLTLRENTERPITVELGTNVVVGTDTSRIVAAASAALNGSAKRTTHQPPFWDGHASERILDALE